MLEHAPNVPFKLPKDCYVVGSCVDPFQRMSEVGDIDLLPTTPKARKKIFKILKKNGYKNNKYRNNDWRDVYEKEDSLDVEVIKTMPLQDWFDTCILHARKIAVDYKGKLHYHSFSVLEDLEYKIIRINGDLQDVVRGLLLIDKYRQRGWAMSVKDIEGLAKIIKDRVLADYFGDSSALSKIYKGSYS
ncbi:MAG: hypothetical protein CL489_10400 [Acidobacteria bacterium]|nr:hypothetical protein [Acidobacteriota bacterium]|tara:strand:+ start:18170 stop:18733 length:564 start_codon:yes stop_codon:yes gene_type:complete